MNLKPRLLIHAAALIALAALPGCANRTVKPEVEPPPPPSMPLRQGLPVYMKGTIWEYTDVANNGPFIATSYGLVTGLRGTGDSFAPNLVRDWVVKEIIRHGFSGHSGAANYADVTPEKILSDPRNAIVMAGGYIPPGARKGQKFDVEVQALAGGNTTSLAHGQLYSADLRILGANPQSPGGSVNVYATARGNILVNPAYVLAPATTKPARAPEDRGNDDPTVPQNAERASLRYGTIPNGGIVSVDRPLHLVLRQPQWALSYAIQERIRQQFQTGESGTVAQAQNEKVIHLLTPENFNGDWERFVGVATHLYMNATPEYLDQQAERLAAAAEKPNAALQDICYCWEGIGRPALPYITPLFTSKSPDVSFAAAQAAAHIGDRSAQDILLNIARTPKHPFQLNAVQVLGQLPKSEYLHNMLATLLDNYEADVRIEAYKILARDADARIWSIPIQNAFWLDVVPTQGQPLIYASRTGEPRLALFAHLDRTGKPQLNVNLPITFTAFDRKFSITSDLDHPRTVTLYWRGDGRADPQPILSTPELSKIVAIMGGQGAEDEASRLHFGYGDIVSVVKSLSERDYIPARFVLQDLPTIPTNSDEQQTTPADQGRPQGTATPTPQANAK